MNEALIEAVLAEVRRRQADQQTDRPAALLIGRQPVRDLGWRYVSGGDYTAVVVGSMDAAAALHFPDGNCAQALLEGKPLFVCEDGLDYRKHSRTANRALWSRLLAAERQMKQLGVRFISGLPHTGSALLTAEEVRRRQREGLPIEGRLTPLARDLLEGRQ